MCVVAWLEKGHVPHLQQTKYMTNKPKHYTIPWLFLLPKTEALSFFPLSHAQTNTNHNCISQTLSIFSPIKHAYGSFITVGCVKYGGKFQSSKTLINLFQFMLHDPLVQTSNSVFTMHVLETCSSWLSWCSRKWTSRF